LTSPAPQSKYYNVPAEEAARLLKSDLASGLSSYEASIRLSEYGPNALADKKTVSALSIFIEQFKDFIIWVLIGAAAVSGFLQEWVDAAAIIAIVLLNAMLGFIQEYRAEKSLEALKKLASPTSKAIRGGERKVVQSSQLVFGDLIELEAGDSVPADSRLVWVTSNFGVQESSLTGESVPVIKTASALEEADIPLADRANMIYMGTSVVSGKAKALVTGTGMRTELGKIATMVGEVARETTPLQRKLEDFGKWIVYLCFALVALVFLLEFLRGGKLIDVFLTAVSLAVAAIPEGLPAVVTIALALGVHRMVRRNAIIRKLPSVETLGCATVVCSDKTGTLTKNEMTVRAVFAGGKLFDVTGTGYAPVGDFLLNGRKTDPSADRDLSGILRAATLCSGAELKNSGTAYSVIGDPTEGALLTAAAKAGMLKEALEKESPFLDEIPFDSERKRMTTVRQDGRTVTAFVKGAPDVLLKLCSDIEERGAARPIGADDIRKAHKVNDELAAKAMRVLAVAYRRLAQGEDIDDAAGVETDLVFLGLIAMMDPPREEVKSAIKQCEESGIKAVMITGDHKNTAVAVAKELGLFKDDSIALSGEELSAFGEERFNEVVERVTVYARVSPEHKLRVVRAWKKRGQIVAMTGDGVNDAPAIKEADIGIAMGITGTDVTKEVSDMIITDDNFASIVAAVEEGRGIYDNIRKFVHYLLSCNAGEILVMFIASLVGFPAPLLPIHILWVNLVTDSFPALALGVDPVDPYIMKRPPRKPDEAVVTRPMVFNILTQGSFIAFCSLLAFIIVLFIEKEGIERARTAAFIVLSCSQLFHSFNCRSATESIFKLGLLTNKKLIAAFAVSFLLQMAVVYIPGLCHIFKTAPLGILDWMVVISVSSLPLWAVEVSKAAAKVRS
jgi:Ca2+-transporting ATPase